MKIEKKSVHVTFTPEIKAQLLQEANKQERTIQAQIRFFVMKCLKELQEHEPHTVKPVSIIDRSPPLPLTPPPPPKVRSALPESTKSLLRIAREQAEKGEL